MNVLWLIKLFVIYYLVRSMKNYYKIRVGLAQMNPVMGDMPKNRAKILELIERGESENCDFILFPEMAVTGYPVQDLIFVHNFVDNNLQIIDQIKDHVKNSVVIIGCITKNSASESSLTPFHNSAAIIFPGGQVKYVHKHLLPNYDVFDEKRYFAPSNKFEVFDFHGVKFGVEICEDLWDEQYDTNVTSNIRRLGANCIFNINASPYYVGKPEIREKVIQKHVKSESIPLVYLNMVGGQDEITFDGRSVVYDHAGTPIARLPAFQEDFEAVEMTVPVEEHLRELEDRKIEEYAPQNAYPLKVDQNADIYDALALNLRDYYEKVGIFNKIVVGLSGGIDSAFTAVIACKAVGPENVVGVLMPSRFSSGHSVDDAKALCKNLGMKYHIVPIKQMHQAAEKVLWDQFNVEKFDIADENLQSRLRGVILMYYSNKFDALLVSTGNKSEIAVGYCTLYGDTNGGKNVPGDLFKVDIYRLAKWLNREHREATGGLIFPENTIEKAPSAELRENQTDQDSLPPYEVLDAVLLEFIENDKSFAEIIEMGFDEKTVRRIERLYYSAEFKRAQMAQTIKLTKKGFGIGRRLPILNKYHIKRDKI